jgi:hypothetical protein
VTVIEGKTGANVKVTPTSAATTKPKVVKNQFKVTKNEAPNAVPSPSGSKASVGFNNLKPGQKIKVTVKTGGTKK